MPKETNAQLLKRYQTVKTKYEKAVKAVEKAKLGSPNRTRKALWAGSLGFTLLQIESEITNRNLNK